MIFIRLVAGIDEAGRGPVVGPMVIAGILIEEEKTPILSELGVRDSKKLSPKRREKLYCEILKKVKAHHVEVIDARTIDVERRRKSLNTIEAEVMAKVIAKLGPDLVQVGSVEIKAEKFRDKLLRRTRNVEIVSVHHAEDFFPAVAAASIIAKVTRDRIVSKLREKYGDFGSGYPSDRRTVDFIIDLVSRGEVPDCVRRTWSTTQKILGSSLYNTRLGQD